MRSLLPLWQHAVMTLSEYLKAEGLTAAALAARAGVSKAAISRWLAGQRMPSATTAEKLFHATGGRVDVAATIRRPAPEAAQ